LVEHDAQIGNNCHLATSSVVNGGVSIGDCTFLGSNSVCREFIRIGRNVVIGAGVNVYKNINDNCFIKITP
jgi:UDP-3-O-[3-hydroxymyristoyl] glucosamine N-acyltransferase